MQQFDCRTCASTFISCVKWSATVAMETTQVTQHIPSFLATISKQRNNDPLCQKLMITGQFWRGCAEYRRAPVFLRH